MKKGYEKPPTISTVKAPVHPLFETISNKKKDPKKINPRRS